MFARPRNLSLDIAQTSAGATEDTASSDLLSNLGPFRRHLDAANRSPNTIRAYTEAVRQLDVFLATQGMPRVLGALAREHVEAFIVDQLTRHKPASTANRYRSLQQFFRWLAEEGEIRESPMARMKPPTIPKTPPPILREEETDALLKATPKYLASLARRARAGERIDCRSYREHRGSHRWSEGRWGCDACEGTAA